jgi:hypothetical protein
MVDATKIMSFLPYLLTREKKMIINNSIESCRVIKTKKNTDFQKTKPSEPLLFCFVFIILNDK